MSDPESGSERWLTAVLEEYRSLRQESLQALSQQQTALQFGLSVLGLLVGLTVQQAGQDDVLLSTVMGTAFVPLVAGFVVMIWLGELERLARAGFHLAAVEFSVNKTLGRPGLWWESALQTGRGPYARLRWRYHAVIAVFVIVALIGAVVGNSELAREADTPWVVLVSVVDAALVAAIAAWYYMQFKRLGRFRVSELALRSIEGDPQTPILGPPQEVVEQIELVSRELNRKLFGRSR